MVYSHTQISQYIRCPRAYRYRYLDGWREKKIPGLRWCLVDALKGLSGLLRTGRLHRGALQGMGRFP